MDKKILGTVKTWDGLAEAFADEITAWQEATGSDDICVAYLTFTNLAAKHNQIEIETIENFPQRLE